MQKRDVPTKDFPYLLHPCNTTLVTTIGKDGKPNVLAIAWITPVSVEPPYLALSIRPERYSHNLLMETGEFVVNIPTFKLAPQVVFCGRKSGRDCNKFEETELTPKKAKKVASPIIEECIAHLECKMEKAIEIGDHTLFIGKVLTAYASKDYFKKSYSIKHFHPLLHIRKNNFTTTNEEIVEYPNP